MACKMNLTGKRREFFEWRRRCNSWRRLAIDTYIDGAKARRPPIAGEFSRYRAPNGRTFQRPWLWSRR